jgi:hypothetical protein
MVKCGVLFDVWPGILNIILMSFGFKGLNYSPSGFVHIPMSVPILEALLEIIF